MLRAQVFAKHAQMLVIKIGLTVHQDGELIRRWSLFLRLSTQTENLSITLLDLNLFAMNDFPNLSIPIRTGSTFIVSPVLQVAGSGLDACTVFKFTTCNASQKRHNMQRLV
jgi:hypothetical protein